MPLALIETSHCNVDLKPSPIEPSWILEGNPEARSCPLSISADSAARTLIWSCTEGKFNWYYDVDETIVILEGSIVLESEGMPPKRYGVGDVIFFRNGAHAKWHVEGHVKTGSVWPFAPSTSSSGCSSFPAGVAPRRNKSLPHFMLAMPLRPAFRGGAKHSSLLPRSSLTT